MDTHVSMFLQLRLYPIADTHVSVENCGGNACVHPALPLHEVASKRTDRMARSLIAQTVYRRIRTNRMVRSIARTMKLQLQNLSTW